MQSRQIDGHGLYLSLLAGLAVLCLAAALVWFARPQPETAAPRYLLKDSGGHVALYTADGIGPLATYDDLYTRLLPESECRFTSRSDQPVSPGWHAIEHAAPQEEQDDTDETAGNIIPVNLTDGVFIAPVPQDGATLSEGKTKPPKPFTEATLLAAMEHASRWVEAKELKAALEDDESHSGGIGTPATRANIIEQLVHSGYVDRKGKQLRSTEQGRSLIDVVATKLKDVALTAGMERRLSEVEHTHADPAQVETAFRDLAVLIPADARFTRPAGPCADEDAEHGVVRPLPTLWQARHQNGQGVPMLHQPARETIRRHMEDHGRMRLARLDDRSRQNRHRLRHTPAARRTEGQPEGLHLEEGQQIRRLARRRQGSRRHLRLRQ